MVNTSHAGLVVIGALLAFACQGVRAADPEPPPLPKQDAVWLHYAGVVQKLTPRSITIQFQNPKVPPREFLLSEDLMAGKVPSRPRVVPNLREYKVSPAYMYRLKDILVGDWVSIEYSFLGGVSTCDHISIVKRPGGRVPPLPEEAEAMARPPAPPPGSGGVGTFYIPYHERMNAYWDLVDHRSPYPEHFGPRRKFPPPLPVAPPPREVGLAPAGR